MRSRKSVLITAVALSLLPAAIPMTALARKHPSPRGRCRVSIEIAPRQIVAGDPVVVFGRLRCANPVNEANQEVKLFHHVVGTPGYSYVQSVSTDAQGFYEISPADGVIETNRSLFVRSRGAVSAAKRIRVAAEVTLTGPQEGQLLTGAANRVTFTGTVSPADEGARAILQRQDATTGGQWHRIDAGTVASGGGFTIVHTFVVPGDANIRVLVRSQRRNVPSISNVLAYAISQTQNPELTIAASADPIGFGESVTISGKLANGANQPVTLLARTVHQHGFARVAETSANSAGEYGFAPQSPVNSTFYEVRARSTACRHGSPPYTGCSAPQIHSAVLYEGVKDVLTAQVSAGTVQAGQPVTFTGTVAPDHTGHAIYLERQNASGSGFHVIQVAVVGSGSAYTITHRLYNPGTKVLRIFIPGGPENEGAASEPFTIQVTPAPASALAPEPTENSTVPPEGQS